MKVTRKCQALDSDAKLCGCEKGLKKYDYHGDPSIFGWGEGNTWVRVYLCRKHQGVLTPNYIKT